nr:T9SS type A sorting domain-containing protein [Ignavibacteria bacterium]
YYAELPTQYDILTLKMNSIGNKTWISGYNNNFDNSPDYLYDLKIDNANYTYILVRSRNAQLRSDIVLIKYDDQTGDSIWTKKYQSVPFANDEPSEMSIDKYNNIYITGSSDFNLINNRIVTIKYNYQGILQWHTEYTPSVFVNSEGRKILNDTLGNLYVSGITNSSSNGDDIVLLKYSNITNIEHVNNSIPNKFELYQNYPNPFNSQTEIKFEIVKNNRYKFEIFDIQGRRVCLNFDENKNAGSYKIRFNASALPSGIYLYKLSSDDISMIKKFTLIK